MKGAKEVRNEVAADLRSVVQATRKQIARQERSVNAERKFIASLARLVAAESPTHKAQFDDILPGFALYSETTQAYRSAETRAIEDLNDCSERFTPIIRIAQARNVAKTKATDARAKLASAKSDLARQGAKGEAAVYDAKQKVIRRIDKLTERLRKLVDLDRQYLAAKERYNAFRRRRTQQSYFHLGAGITLHKQAEADAWRYIESAIAAIERGETPEKPGLYVAAEEAVPLMESPHESTGVDAFRPELEPEAEPEPMSTPVAVSHNPFDDDEPYVYGDSPF
jgi:hypothetical protein